MYEVQEIQWDGTKYVKNASYTARGIDQLAGLYEWI